MTMTTSERPIATEWPVVSGTGHRPQHLAAQARAWLRDKLRKAACWLRDERGTRVGISGMAIGFDLWWADAIIGAGLTLGAYIPCPQQADRWTAAYRAEWQRLRDLADPAVSRSFADHYSVGVLHKRNKAMLRDSNAVLCGWLPSRRNGGTWSAVRAAHAMGKPGLHLDPGAQTVRLGLPSLTLAGAA